MSNSIKKHGFYKSASSERAWKKMYHKKSRALTRKSLYYITKGFDDVIMPDLKNDYSDLWDSKQDGPKYWANDKKDFRK